MKVTVFMKFSFAFLILFLFCSSAYSQYSPFYKENRNLTSFSFWDDYLSIINEYNTSKSGSIAISRTDSLAGLALEQGDFLQFLFLKNEVSNYYKFDNNFNDGYADLHSAMQLFASKQDTIILEYAVSLRLLRGLLTRSSHVSRGEEELLNSQLAILDSLKIDGEPMTNTLVDFGMFLNRKGDKENALDLLHRARKFALDKDDMLSYAVADYVFISIVSDLYDLQETTLEVIRNNISILESRPASIPILVYTSYFNYLLGSRSYYYNEHIDNAVYFLEKTIACLDTLDYPVWNLKASSHSVLTQCFADRSNLPEFWHHYAQAKEIAGTRPMAAYNKSLAFVNIADAVIPISVDSTFMLLEIISKQEGHVHFTDKIAEIEAKALMKIGNYQLAIEVLNNNFDVNETVDGKTVPVISDSIPLVNQLHLIGLLTDCYRQLDELSGKDENIEVIIDLILKQNEAYIRAMHGVYGVELSSLVKDFQVFLLPALEYLLKKGSIRNTQDEAARLFFTSKALQLNINLGKLALEGSYETDTTLFHKILKNNAQIQKAKSAIVGRGTSQEMSWQEKVDLNSLLVENLYLKYKQRRSSEIDFNTIEIPDLISVQLKLNENEGIVEFCVGESALMSQFISRDTIIQTYLKVDSLEEFLLGEIYSIRTGGDVTKQLSTILLDRFEQDISKLKKLIIVPDNKLLQIPFELLVLPSTGKNLINHLPIAYSYSTSLWYLHEENPKDISSKQILAVAPLFFNQQKANLNNLFVSSVYRGSEYLSPLHFSEVEVNTIANSFPKFQSGIKTLMGESANKNALLHTIEEFDIIHFATHGLVNREYHERSGLYLYPEVFNDTTSLNEDFFLSLGELYNLRLRADLVVLSACHSASGAIHEGEGVIALPRGFIYAGVPNVIASLWRVNDEKTKDLMIAFYKHLHDGRSYSEALRLAKLDCIEKGFLLLDWAGFVLIGG